MASAAGSQHSSNRRSYGRSASLSKSGSLDKGSSRSSLFSSNLSAITSRKGSANTHALRESGYESLKLSPVQVHVPTGSQERVPEKLGSPTRKLARTDSSRNEVALQLAKNSPDESSFFRAPLSVSKEDLIAINSQQTSPNQHIPKSYSICPALMKQHMVAAMAELQQQEPEDRRERARRMSECSKKSWSLLRAQSTFDLAHEMEIPDEASSGEALRSYASMSSVFTNGTGYEYDDFLGNYYDEGQTPPYSGGLISNQLARTNSAWSLQSEPLSASLLNLMNDGKSSVIHEDKAEVEHVKLRRRDLDVEEFLRSTSKNK